MLGWCVSLALLIIYIQKHKAVDVDIALLSAGLFAIAGSIGMFGGKFVSAIDKGDK